MALKRSYLIDPIETYLDLIQKLSLGSKHLLKDGEVAQTLASLTGLSEDFFLKIVDADILFSVLSMLPTDEQKAIAALILWHEDQNTHAQIARKIIDRINQKDIDERVREIISKSL
ncbi:MAG: hypothetical protein KC505_04350 [Myxococcales bacterium]|nr:hypothetical protein [Myxococcales bacterium]USN51218.1 MAG: hypothetical protein H6731_02065 [Myxococcales bacterium]